MTRQWVDQARKIGQLPGSGAPDGTFAAGVTRVTELLPVLMNDIIQSAPEDQKVRSRYRVWCCARPCRCYFFKSCNYFYILYPPLPQKSYPSLDENT